MLKVIDKGTTKFSKMSITFGVLTAAETFNVSEAVVLVNIAPIDEITKKSFAGTATKAAIGSLVLGPVGLLAGALGGGKKEITAVLEFDDGGQLVAKMDNKTYAKLVGIAIKNQNRPTQTEQQTKEDNADNAKTNTEKVFEQPIIQPKQQKSVEKITFSFNQQNTKKKTGTKNPIIYLLLVLLPLMAILAYMGYKEYVKREEEKYAYSYELGKSGVTADDYIKKEAKKASYENKADTNEKTEGKTEVKDLNRDWKGSTEFYNAYAEEGHSADYIENALPLKYNWIKSAKDVLTAATDFGYFSAEYQVKATKGEFNSDKEKLEYGANILADSYYIEWVAKKYNVSPQQRNKAIQKGINEYIKGK